MLSVRDADRVFWSWVDDLVSSGDIESRQDIEDYHYPPSKLSVPDPYVEELEHILDDSSYDFPENPMPLELIAYFLSLWSGSDVPVDHPLVRQHAKWKEVLIDAGFGNVNKADLKQLFLLIRGIAKRPEVVENLPDFSDVRDFADSDDIQSSEGVKIVRIPDVGDYFIAVLNDMVVFLDVNTNDYKVYDFDGNRVDVDNDKIISYIRSAPKSLIDFGALSSVVGNTLAGLVVGDDGISILDLP